MSDGINFYLHDVTRGNRAPSSPQRRNSGRVSREKQRKRRNGMVTVSWCPMWKCTLFVRGVNLWIKAEC